MSDKINVECVEDEFSSFKILLFNKVVPSAKKYFPDCDSSEDKMINCIFMTFRLWHVVFNCERQLLASTVGIMALSIDYIFDFLIKNAIIESINFDEIYNMVTFDKVRSLTPFDHLHKISGQLWNFCKVFMVYILRNKKIYNYDSLTIALSILDIASFNCHTLPYDGNKIVIPKDLSYGKIYECQSAIFEDDYDDNILSILSQSCCHQQLFEKVKKFRDFFVPNRKLVLSKFNIEFVETPNIVDATSQESNFKYKKGSSMKIGFGTYSKVYKNRMAGEEVAIKQFKNKYYFADELEINTQLNHPNISRMKCYNKEKIFIVYKLANFDLAKYLSVCKNKGIEDVRLIKSYVYQLASAIAYCHSKNIVHLDIKPHNILLYKNGQLELADFGSSLVVHYNDNDIDIYERGTAAFLPPECCDESPTVSAEDIFSVDIWSFGYTILNMFTGNMLPKNFLEILEKKGAKYFSNKIDNDSDDLICKMLKRNPSERIKSQDILLHPFFDSIKDCMKKYL